jgi:hypothetical protein
MIDVGAYGRQNDTKTFSDSDFRKKTAATSNEFPYL